MRTLTFAQAIAEALGLALERDPRVYVTGLGVNDPRGIFGTTAGLKERFGVERVFDMPCAENGMTGVAIGSALAGMRPVMVHQRADFTLLALDQLANTAAKWYFTFGGRQSVPLVVRMIVGRGWGQGPQHSQQLHALFGHFPGLKVVMPASPRDAKGMLLAAIADPNPVVFIEHRWLHDTYGEVPEAYYEAPLEGARVVREGGDLTIVAGSLARLDAIAAADALVTAGIEAEVVDIRAVKPLDRATICASARKTGRVLVVDHGWRTLGLAAEILASVGEACFGELRAAPVRLTPPDGYVSTDPATAAEFYPTISQIAAAALRLCGREAWPDERLGIVAPTHLDVPNPAFRGPF